MAHRQAETANDGPPLPKGWDVGRDYDGKVYYIDHNTKQTTWCDPRTSSYGGADLQPADSASGWDLSQFDARGMASANNAEHIQAAAMHHASSGSLLGDDQSLGWRQMQEDMLRQYLATAEEDLLAKKELVDIKQQRLHLAQDEYSHLHHRLAALSTSTTSFSSFPAYSDNSDSYSYGYGSSSLAGGISPSRLSLNSTGSSASTSSKYDLDLLKSDVEHARARVQRLRGELANIGSEVVYQQRGVETLAHMSAKFSDERRCLSLEEAQAIRVELHNIQKSLSTGEQEKAELMKSLACLKDDLTRLQHSESTLDVAAMIMANPLEKFSTASQTDLSGEMMPVGARLAEMARLRLQYDEARRTVQYIQQSLSSLEDRLSPGQLESDKDRLLLIQDKEQLLRELRAITPRSRSQHEMAEIQAKIHQLQLDLNQAMEMSNRCIADRLRLHEEKQMLLQQLRDGMRTMTRLESQLKLLSASTLSMSSSSSLGSLSSSHASSKGSLSSLSFTDIYGLSTTTVADPSMLDLHRRVDKILNNNSVDALSGRPNNFIGSSTNSPEQQKSPQNHHHSLIATPLLPESGLNSADESLTTPESETASTSTSHLLPPHSQPSLSPRSSLSSVSPPVSPLDAAGHTVPPAYDQAFAERQRRLIQQQQLFQQQLESRHLTEQLVELRAQNRSKLSTISELNIQAIHPKNLGLEVEQMLNQQYGFCSSESVSSRASVSAAVSDESVAGDSGVFEAAAPKSKSRRAKNSAEAVELLQRGALETAQVQIKLRYAPADGVLYVGIERALNLAALFVPEHRKICIKASLLPSSTTSSGCSSPSWSLCTQSVPLPTGDEQQKPVSFGDTFPLAVEMSKLVSKTLQVTIWTSAVPDVGILEECLGAAQVSLADFDIETVSVKWYNVLSFHFLQQPMGGSPASSPRAHSSREAAPPHTHLAPAARHFHLKQASSEMSSAMSSKQGTLKEGESSDESTIISSQASTLTRDVIPPPAMPHRAHDVDEEAIMALLLKGRAHSNIMENEETDDEDDADDGDVDYSDVVIPNLPEMMASMAALQQPSVQLEDSLALVDKETNTECVFVQPSMTKRTQLQPQPNTREAALSGLSPTSAMAIQALVKRSQTFSPRAPTTDYICKLNRSDSDSAMAINKRMPFQRSVCERRSLRVPCHTLTRPNSLAMAVTIRAGAQTGAIPKTRTKTPHVPTPQTPLDLEMDLAAQQAKLRVLQDDIDRLKSIKTRLEEARSMGSKELPDWLQEHEQFQQLLSKLQTDVQEANAKEEKRVEKLLRKTGRDLYKLRKTKTTAKGQLDVQSFREKMAFFTTLKNDVPIPPEADEQSEGAVSDAEGEESMSHSRETVNTLTEEEGEDEEEADANKAVDMSVTSAEQADRYTYEIDPDIGVIV